MSSREETFLKIVCFSIPETNVAIRQLYVLYTNNITEQAALTKALDVTPSHLQTLQFKLHELILDSLLFLHSSYYSKKIKSVESKVMRMLGHAEILIQKGHSEFAARRLHKAVKLCEERQIDGLKIEAIR